MVFHPLSKLADPVVHAGQTLPLVWGALSWSITVVVMMVALFITRRQSQRIIAARMKLARQDAQLAETDSLRDELAFQKQHTQSLEQQHAIANTRLEERERALSEMRTRFETEFQTIATQLLGSAHDSFLQRADETFKHHQAKAHGDSKLRAQALDDMIRPMKETLARYEQGLSEMRDHQKKSQGELQGRIAELAQSTLHVSTETAKLASALKSGPRTRGRWGEAQLRNVVELVGLSAYCDFEEQVSIQDGSSQKRPDMIVRLPGCRVIAIDAKVSLSAYLDAIECTDDAQRNLLLQKHGEEIWAHVRDLGAKEYAASLRKTGTLDFVIMFIPGENFFAAAMEARPQLFQDAFDRHVLLATPTTLIAILKSIAYGWRQEKATEHAVVVADMARELYENLQRMGSNLSNLGKSLETTVKRYNDTVGNIEGRVMPKARRFAEYEMPGTQEKIAVLEPLDTDVRDVRPDRDLLVQSQHQSTGS